MEGTTRKQDYPLDAVTGTTEGGCMMSSEEKLALIDKIYADGFEVEPKEECRYGHYYGLLSAIYSVIHFEEAE